MLKMINNTTLAERDTSCVKGLICTGIFQGNMYLRKSGHTACDGNCAVNAARQSYYYLSSVFVLDGAILYAYETNSRQISDGVKIHVDHFELQKSARLSGQATAEIIANTVEFEKSSNIGQYNNEYFGYTAQNGEGKGTKCETYYGIGAGHGGYGGYYSACNGNYGQPYGDACLPLKVGSGGGNCHNDRTGGTGGGAMKIIAGCLGLLESTIQENGINGGAGAGGGSGGSILFDADYLEGWGFMYANGGSAQQSCLQYCNYNENYQHRYDCRAGTGAGGRIRTYPYTYGNKVLVHQRYVNAGSGGNYAGQSGTLCESGGNLCAGAGTYNSDTKLCECNDGFTGADCQYECDKTTHCNDHGSCSNSGGCDCDEGWVGYHCEHECLASTNCSGNGVCSATGKCICDPCFHGNDCSQECSSNGQCVGGQCICDDCHLGEYCASECNEHGSCTTYTNQEMNCTCDDLWTDYKCTQPACPGDDKNCNGHGVCNSALHVCYCDPGWAGLYESQMVK